jgi:hypothetical protein
MLGYFALDPSGAEEFTVGLRPSQFYRVFDNEDRAFADETYTDVFGVAHNSGGRIETTLEALIYGADVIEVDIVEVDGALYSAHTPPLPFLGPHFFRGPSLDQIWNASYRADALKLDLKESSPQFVGLVADFLVSRPGGRDVMVASRSPDVLRTLRQRAPEAVLLLSVPSAGAFDNLQADGSLQAAIDGVTIRQSLVDADRASWLTEHDLLIFAWTVNDLARVNELIQLGAAGITTENLAILTLLGGLERREQEVPVSTPQASEQVPNGTAAEKREDQRPGQAYLHPGRDEANLDHHEVVGNEQDQEAKEHGHRHQHRQAAVREERARSLRAVRRSHSPLPIQHASTVGNGPGAARRGACRPASRYGTHMRQPGGGDVTPERKMGIGGVQEPFGLVGIGYTSSGKW